MLSKPTWLLGVIKGISPFADAIVYLRSVLIIIKNESDEYLGYETFFNSSKRRGWFVMISLEIDNESGNFALSSTWSVLPMVTERGSKTSAF